jgi:adenosylcobinamide-GDP ribazoletransferase
MQEHPPLERSPQSIAATPPHSSVTTENEHFFAQVLGAIVFYTVLPVPASNLNFQRVARWVPLVGILIGVLLVALGLFLEKIGMPALTTSALVVAAWVGVTGGLHLDGAMDTADGLAVMDPERRLDVMADSRSGAFGVMAAVLLLLIKTAALTDLSTEHWWVLVLAAGWGRWGQQVAIARYPYLKAVGKGAFHKTALPTFRAVLPGLVLLTGVTLSLAGLVGMLLGGVVLNLVSPAIALLVAAYFHHRLGGHTGDTYGAVVEWTEALVLVTGTLL